MFQGEMNVERKQSFGGRTPSGFQHSWRLWRLCCCRYGWYPLLVAPLVTVGCIFSLYSAAGCDFIRVDVGFTPSNTGWNSSSLKLGLFLYQSGEEDTNKYYAAFLNGCRLYPKELSDEFVEDDRTWKVAQIMAYVSAGGGIIATIFTWLFVVSPLPARFFWPVVVLPALVASFLAEASKFLFYDTSMCRKNVWFPPGTESLPRTAECSLGATAIYGIASGVIFLVCLVLVCLKAPNRRVLVPNYGLDVENGCVQPPPNQASYYGIEGSDRYTNNTVFDSHSERGHYEYPNRPTVGAPGLYANDEDGDSGVTSSNSRGFDSGFESSVTGKSSVDREIHDDEDDLLSQQRSMSVSHMGDGDSEGKYNPRQPPATDVTIVRNRSGGNPMLVSRSRLETVERMEKNVSTASDTSVQMIDQLLNDLNESFNDDSYKESSVR
mmetsp:Transcript_3061/g.6595  ORF Transcript_3061/g.6595 Transcript_3061/m.6595 type:complete len:436 (+) Transcript_3061:175-1482(+)|eukprot:CAMPEP_0168234564 /NCGR_PEP_ID=MMETSP0140_2-20121125/18332_1 /TAXON_ID=44445 /ORGANISM="Pseudo-nitzschia australis, Strain 10249 10 AB" /LENGTH=435 /DNA_ID=CAMNT_0008167363 /DNA_START=143 /DNA_END=1453 /DNA_ORIENTATION=-